MAIWNPNVNFNYRQCEPEICSDVNKLLALESYCVRTSVSDSEILVCGVFFSKAENVILLQKQNREEMEFILIS